MNVNHTDRERAVNGLLSHDSASQIAVDMLAGAASGGLIGMTDGLSLVGGAITSMGIESARQMANWGLSPCHDMDVNLWEIGLAGVGSGVGHEIGIATDGALDGALSGRSVKAISGGFESSFGGAIEAPPSAVDGFNKENP